MNKNPIFQRSYIICPDCNKCVQFNIEWVAGNSLAWVEINCCQCGFIFTSADITNEEKGFSVPASILAMLDDKCEACKYYDKVAQEHHLDWYLKGNEDARKSHMEKDHK